MCYPNGGDQPTITDANLVLGRLPAALIGGGIALDVTRAEKGMADLAQRLGGKMTSMQMAAGIVEIANWNQANRIRQMTIQRGIDPREFALLSFGGAGPVQSAAVAQLIGMKATIIPPSPGNLAAFGLLAVDWRNDQMITRVMPEEKIDLAVISDIYAGLEADAVRRLEADGIAKDRIRLVREADLRYAGQSMEVRIVAPGGNIDLGFVDALIDSFHAAHRRNFGYDYKGEQKIEIVNFCVSGFGMIERPSLPKLAVKLGAKPAPKGRRLVYFDDAMRETEIFDRATLPPDAKIEGAAIVEEFGSTSVVFPGQTLHVDDYGIMVIRQNGH
jgi:N-methylhydantoinase A